MDANGLAQKSLASLGGIDRPFYFNLVVWGDAFRRYFLEYCLPSLLSPRNIPALSLARNSKFLIATHAEDWRIIAATPIFQRMAQYVKPVFIELPAEPPSDRDANFNGLGFNLGLMGVGHGLISAMSFRDRAYAVYLAPDSMLSDGSVAQLDAHARSGVELVLCPALRLGEEPFFAGLTAQGIALEESQIASGRPLTISGRQMVRAALGGLHSETLTYEWDAPFFFARRPSAIWSRVPDEAGLLLHVLNWMPLLFDFGAVAEHDSSSLETWTLDGDYVYKNLGHSRAIYVVQDSDEIYLASWAPLSDRPRKVTARYRQWPGFLEARRRRLSDAWKGLVFRDSFYSGYYDPLKQEIFFRPVYWHVTDVNQTWEKAEEKVRTLLRRYVRPPGTVCERKPLVWRVCRFVFVILLVRITVHTQEFWDHRDSIFQRLGEMARGDRGAWRRAVTRIRSTLRRIAASEN